MFRFPVTETELFHRDSLRLKAKATSSSRTAQSNVDAPPATTLGDATNVFARNWGGNHHLLEVSQQAMSVRTDNGRSVTFELKDYDRIDHGYAATIHKA